MRRVLLAICVSLPMLASAAPPVAATGYNPMAIPANAGTRVVDLSLGGRGPTRQIPLRVYLPETKSAAPVVLFSHGLGGSRESNAFMGDHWAARGYVAVFMQHSGSDDAVWRDSPVGQRMGAL